MSTRDHKAGLSQAIYSLVTVRIWTPDAIGRDAIRRLLYFVLELIFVK